MPAKKAYRVRRFGPGQYELHQTIDGRKHVVTITYFEHLKGWIAAAAWDRFLYTDALHTKWQAVQNGEMMLLEREGADVPPLDRANA